MTEREQLNHGLERIRLTLEQRVAEAAAAPPGWRVQLLHRAIKEASRSIGDLLTPPESQDNG